MHVLSDRSGLPVVVGVSSGNTHEGEALKPIVTELQTRRDPRHGRCVKPGKLYADKAYDRNDLRRRLRGKRIAVRIARKGVESSQRLGRHRGVIERTMSWLIGYRRPPSATNATPATTWPFSGSLPHCAATSGSSGSPHRTRSQTGVLPSPSGPSTGPLRSARPCPVPTLA
ncbi:transposase [Nonomuraea muscovyensis]|uniref:transposase n=1 Tax=Nonomuraea muscovyensis TaxID=1124761 RepID=UPI001C87E601